MVRHELRGTAGVSVVSVVSFTVTWIDRRGRSSAITAGCATFIAGLVTAGVAQTMPVFLVGRVLQGLGGGVTLWRSS